ncbi:MAG: hypothetical protein ICV54_29095 [Nostoc sp. C3-bin3]|nr:hypothetical protein [Nostoc sp. C3-bin3]
MPERKNQPTADSSQLSVRELAKQGNPKAIATLMNRLLQPNGITAKAALKSGCLQVILESAQVPSPSWVTVLRRGLLSLGVTSIKQVKVYGRQVGKEIPAWSQEFKLVPPTNSKRSVVNPSPLSQSDRTQVSTAFLTATTQAETPKVQISPTQQEIYHIPNVTLFFLRLLFGFIGLVGLIKTLVDLISIILNESLARTTLYDSKQLMFSILINLGVVVFSCTYICISFFLKNLLIQAHKFLIITLWAVIGCYLVSFLFNLAKLTIAGSNYTAYELGYLISLGAFLLINGYLLYRVKCLSTKLKSTQQNISQKRTRKSSSTRNFKPRKTG